MTHKTLSIVHPNGTRIANGEKTIEVRRWLPPADLTGDLLIVENKNFLYNEGETDVGTPRRFRKNKIRRPFEEKDILAARGIYELEIDL